MSASKPIAIERLRDMNVAVDASGQHKHVAGVDHFVCVGQRFADGDNAPIPDPDISPAGFAGGGNRQRGE
jgi:hypothetical protein